MLPFDSLKLRETKDFFADDYGNIYLYKNRDFSFTKYDSVGKQLGKTMMTVPFRVQDVQNPLNIVLFSANAQELKFLDQNLVEIQKIDFRQKFGFVSAAYTEDLQQVWLLNESTKTLVQYNYRDDIIINSYPLSINFDEVVDFLVFERKIYLLTENSFKILDFDGKILQESPVANAKKLRRENEQILVFSKDTISLWKNNSLKKVFNTDKSMIVDKNSTAYFVIISNKLYLYKP
mgnify:CR=1 FL=1